MPRDDPLLPQPVRRALGLPTARDRELAARHHFDELAAGCDELHLFSVDDGKAEPSRFVERLLWERQRDGRILDGASLLSHVHYRMSLVAPAPPAIAKTPEVAARLPTMSFSASSLDAYLACPLRFHHSRVLGLREKDEATGEVDRMEIGTVVHEAIPRFLAPFAGGPAIEPGALDARRMDEIAVERLRAHFGDHEAGPLRIVAGQVRERLGAFVTEWLRPLASRTRLALTALEQTIEAPWEGRQLSGRLDAVFARDGRPWIVDWKTGSSTDWILGRHDRLVPGDRSTWQDGLRSTQLPMYLLLHGAREGRPPLAADAAYVMLGRSRLDADCAVPLFADRDRGRRKLAPDRGDAAAADRRDPRPGHSLRAGRRPGRGLPGLPVHDDLRHGQPGDQAGVPMSAGTRDDRRAMQEGRLLEAIFELVERVTKAELTNSGRKLLISYLSSSPEDTVSARARWAIRRYAQWDPPSMDEVRERHRAGAMEDLDWRVLKVEHEARKLGAAEEQD